MTSIRKQSRDKGQKNKPYYIKYVDHEGKRVTVKGFTDKALTEQLAAKHEQEVLLRKQSPIGDHLAAFDHSLDNTTPKHRKLTMTRVRKPVEATEAKTLADLDAEKLEEPLKEIRREEDLGARIYNHYLQAIDEFGKWLVSTKRLPSNPVAGIDRLNAETDVRHKRRALTADEMSRLVRAARESGVEVQGYAGQLRARIYLMSFITGLRRGELGKLSPRSFKPDEVQPTVVVEAACSKHRRKDTLPMPPSLPH